eukprot:TRINITY_DN24930_c0_g1_i1.p1 TRINITY_DN24930_c0_g1~~TRINITY_DN24930_c0_g1_i1.p1  ORF type:complete len:642 (+),score=220.46 TRINITY_DN24930_c0_g1_i1:78-2003(+)
MNEPGAAGAHQPLNANAPQAAGDAGPRREEMPQFPRVKPEKWPSIMRSDGRECNACVKIKKTSTKNLELSRALMVREPLLIMLNTEGKDEDMITRVLPVTEIERIMVYKKDGKVWIKAKEGTGSRDWIFRFEFDPKNTEDPENFGMNILTMIRDMRKVYVEWDPNFKGKPLEIETNEFNRSELYLLGLEKTRHPKTKTVREIMTQLKHNMPKRFIPPVLEEQPAEDPDAAARAVAVAALQEQAVQEQRMDEEAPSPMVIVEKENEEVEEVDAPLELRDDEYELVAEYDDEGGLGYGIAASNTPGKPIRVKYVVPGSAADAAGLQTRYPADVVTHVNGQKLSHPRELNQAMNDAIRAGHGRIILRTAPGDEAYDTPEEDEYEDEEEYEDDNTPAANQRQQLQGSLGAHLDQYQDPFAGTRQTLQTEQMLPSLPPRYQQQPLYYACEEGAEGPLSVPRSKSGRPPPSESKRARKKKDQFWKSFVESYDAQQEHYTRIEGDLHRMVDAKVSRKIVPHDFDTQEDYETLAMYRQAQRTAPSAYSPDPAGRGRPLVAAAPASAFRSTYAASPVAVAPTGALQYSPARLQYDPYDFSPGRVSRFHESPARSLGAPTPAVGLGSQARTPFERPPQVHPSRLRHIHLDV